MISYSTAARNAIAAAVVGLVDAGASGGKVRIYSAGKATLLCDVVLPVTAFDTPANGESTLSAASYGNVLANGIAAVYDVTDSDSNIVWSGSVGTSGADLNLRTVELTTSDQIEISGLTYVAPE